jgi:hypothetical protein
MSAKDLVVKPISSQDAARIVKACHYSGKVVQNSQLHFGVFLDGKCGGAMQFGPSLDKRKIQGLVEGTGWNGFIELNRMAFADWLPRNSESRAIAVAMRLIRKAYPHIEWVVSFSDATQCGDGTIYRASGFVLTGLNENTQIVEFPDGLRETRLVLTDLRRPRRVEVAKRYGAKIGGACSLKPFLDIGAKLVPGFQLRYIYFLNPAARSRLTVPVLPFSEIQRRGAGMYLGKAKRADSMGGHASGSQPEEGGSTPTSALQSPTP